MYGYVSVRKERWNRKVRGKGDTYPHVEGVDAAVLLNGRVLAVERHPGGDEEAGHGAVRVRRHVPEGEEPLVVALQGQRHRLRLAQVAVAGHDPQHGRVLAGEKPLETRGLTRKPSPGRGTQRPAPPNRVNRLPCERKRDLGRGPAPFQGRGRLVGVLAPFILAPKLVFPQVKTSLLGISLEKTRKKRFESGFQEKSVPCMGGPSFTLLWERFRSGNGG